MDNDLRPEPLNINTSQIYSTSEQASLLIIRITIRIRVLKMHVVREMVCLGTQIIVDLFSSHMVLY